MAILAAFALPQAALAQPQSSQPIRPPSGDKKKDLAREANDPTSTLILLTFRPIIAFDTVRADGTGGLMQVNFAAPFKKLLPFQQLMRVSVPVVQFTPNPDRTTGFGDLSLFDFKSFRWKRVRLGAGVTFTMPTATDDALGQGKWQIGPSFGVIVPVGHELLAGAVFQNPISFAGDDNRPDVNGLIVSPTLTFNLHGGWFAGMSDLDWEFNWEDTGEHLVPIGVQAGRVIRVGRQGVSLSAEFAYAVIHPSQAAYGKWQFAVEFVLLFPEHPSVRRRASP